MDLTDTTEHENTAAYTFFSEAHRSFSKINHAFRHKASINK